MYAVNYPGGEFSGTILWSLSGTVSTYDGSASPWKSCAWSVGDGDTLIAATENESS